MLEMIVGGLLVVVGVILGAAIPEAKKDKEKD